LKDQSLPLYSAQICSGAIKVRRPHLQGVRFNALLLKMLARLRALVQRQASAGNRRSKRQKMGHDSCLRPYLMQEARSSARRCHENITNTRVFQLKPNVHSFKSLTVGAFESSQVQKQGKVNE
jgi:hypothetical protein